MADRLEQSGCDAAISDDRGQHSAELDADLAGFIRELARSSARHDHAIQGSPENRGRLNEEYKPDAPQGGRLRAVFKRTAIG
ncbi:hypothetical protein EN851_11300 [Mesorhizobium sp. M8A.F.Ca.ET.208.01.1.1]|uniref:hypothetical protein n=1 Tax=unclassified Mesorhizobium TaxID=325217 RepID=UPI001093595F|nr:MULTISPECIES: hypothetical protein [unclassified Mesorhizobium]TGQ92178.1 hypothetical protein EN851_11300 [Mesorhizobium sp. M8A.F.Ca.ET.208.01.1.1]TGT52078.1 hypothetical protein EN810_11290 [Mesorhizobium sp. M8A.F.Ca.ET.167.01.1.1]